MATILITGTSTGIGHAAVELFAERGWTVYAGSRHPDQMTFKNSSIRKIAVDVNDNASIERCFAELPPPRLRREQRRLRTPAAVRGHAAGGN